MDATERENKMVKFTEDEINTIKSTVAQIAPYLTVNVQDNTNFPWRHQVEVAGYASRPTMVKVQYAVMRALGGVITNRRYSMHGRPKGGHRSLFVCLND